MAELQELRRALQDFAAEPITSGVLAKALGFTPIEHPSNLLARNTPFAEAVSPVASAVYHLGSLVASSGSAGLYAVQLEDWGLRSSDRDRARRRIAKAFVQNPFLDRRWLILLVPSESRVYAITFKHLRGARELCCLQRLREHLKSEAERG